MATNISALNVSPDLKQALIDVANGLAGGVLSNVLGDAIVTDLSALRTTLDACVVDLANVVANHNTLIAKLNVDAGVTDTNYAVATAQTSTAPAAITAVAP